MRVRTFTRGILSVAALIATGCSFTFSEGPPDNAASLSYFDCVSTPGLAVADGVVAAANAVNAVAVFSQSQEEYEDEVEDGNRNRDGIMVATIGGVFAASAIYGVVKSERCRKAKAALQRRLARTHERSTTPSIERHVRSLAPQQAQPVDPKGATPVAPDVPTPAPSQIAPSAPPGSAIPVAPEVPIVPPPAAPPAPSEPAPNDGS